MKTPSVVPVVLLACFLCSTIPTLIAAQPSSLEPLEAFPNIAHLHFLAPYKGTDEYKKSSKDDQKAFDCLMDCGEALFKSYDGYDAEALN
jgi:hypothetical protein